MNNTQKALINQDVCEQTTPNLGITQSSGLDRHAVVAPLVILNDQGGASMSVERSNISPTLRSQTHGNLPIIAAMSQSPPAMVSAGFRYKAGSAAGSIGYQEELAPTLMAYQPCGALVAQPERKYIVRRLTPMLSLIHI